MRQRLARYRSALAAALLTQAAVLALAGAALDFGESLRVALIALVAFWVGAFMAIRRDLITPGEFALAYLRVGYLVLVAVSALAAAVMW